MDPDGGLNGLPVPVELTLNGQNYTEDRVEFVYYGHLDLGEARPGQNQSSCSRGPNPLKSPWPF